MGGALVNMANSGCRLTTMRRIPLNCIWKARGKAWKLPPFSHPLKPVHYLQHILNFVYSLRISLSSGYSLLLIASLQGWLEEQQHRGSVQLINYHWLPHIMCFPVWDGRGGRGWGGAGECGGRWGVGGGGGGGSGLVGGWSGLGWGVMGCIKTDTKP